MACMRIPAHAEGQGQPSACGTAAANQHCSKRDGPLHMSLLATLPDARPYVLISHPSTLYACRVNPDVRRLCTLSTAVSIRVQMGADLERVQRERDDALERCAAYTSSSEAADDQMAASHKQLRQMEVRPGPPLSMVYCVAPLSCCVVVL